MGFNQNEWLDGNPMDLMGSNQRKGQLWNKKGRFPSQNPDAKRKEKFLF